MSKIIGLDVSKKCRVHYRNIKKFSLKNFRACKNIINYRKVTNYCEYFKKKHPILLDY